MEEIANDHIEYLEESGNWRDVKLRTFDWDEVYSKEDYMGLLSTFPDIWRWKKVRGINFQGD